MDDKDRELLDFARRTWPRDGSMQRELLKRFGLSQTRYWQRINMLIDTPEAWVYDAQLVKRLRRIRDKRRIA